MEKYFHALWSKCITIATSCHFKVIPLDYAYVHIHICHEIIGFIDKRESCVGIHPIERKIAEYIVQIKMLIELFT